MTAIQAHQQWLIGQPFGGRKDAFQSILEFGLAMLFAHSKFIGQAPVLVQRDLDLALL